MHPIIAVVIPITIAQRGRTSVLPSQLLNRHLLVSSQLIDLLLDRCRVIPSFTLLRRDRALVILLAVAVEVTVTTLVVGMVQKQRERDYNSYHAR